MVVVVGLSVASKLRDHVTVYGGLLGLLKRSGSESSVSFPTFLLIKKWPTKRRKKKRERIKKKK